MGELAGSSGAGPESVGRLFVAVDLPEPARHALAAHLQAELDGRPIPGRPVPPDRWHFTLRFLGSTDAVRHQRLLAALDQADLGPRFVVALGGLGSFPNPVRATVLWAAVERGAERLADLAGIAEDAALSAGFSAEERPFHAHLTHSRIRPHQDLRALLDRVAPAPIRLSVDRVVVYRSHLGGGGARYEALESFALSRA
ncbi:MAG: RNA 2',3'-cyclic phosphodiesterase [Acidimicrobiia bacterium]